MAIFRYRKSVDMPPKEGQKFATTYYRQSPEEYQRLRAHIIEVASEIMDLVELNPEWDEFVNEPLKGFGRLNGKANYSINQIIADILEQTTTHKDITQGMIGRWNRLFADTAYDMELLQEHSPTTISPRLFQNLFDQSAGVR